MATDHSGIIRESIELATDRVCEGLARATREIRSSNRALKEGVTREDELVSGKVEGAGPGGVPGGVVGDALDGACGDRLPVLEEEVGLEGRGVLHGREAEHSGLDAKLLVEGKVVLVDPDFALGGSLHGSEASGVVEICV